MILHDVKYQWHTTTNDKSKCLSISRKDGLEIISWDDMMHIKNEVLGNVVAIEIFPKKEDLVNESNTRHLWVIPELQHLGKYPYGNSI